jgi:hypothetical protein
METYTWYVRRPDGYHLLFPSEETPDGMGASHYPAVGQRDPAQAPPAQGAARAAPSWKHQTPVVPKFGIFLVHCARKTGQPSL